MSKVKSAVFLSLACVLTGALALAQWTPNTNNNNPYSRALPLPQVKNVTGTGPSLDAAIKHYVTHSYPGKPGSDPAKLLADYIDAYTAFTGRPNAQKHLILKYFEMGDPTVLDAIKRAVQAGVGRITIITDFNQGMVGTNFPNEHDDSGDFESAKFKNNGMGKALQYLRGLGFVYKVEEGNLVLLSGVLLTSPSKKDQEVALMHDKVAMGEGYPDSLDGSYNPSDVEKESRDGQSWGGRYNSIYLVTDPAITNVDINHAQLEIQEYNKRSGQGVTWDGPYRVNYPDGSFYELAFSDRKYNPNDRITELFTKAADPANKITINEIVFSHFVLTEREEMQALRKLMVAQPDFPFFGVFDQGFIALDGYGEAGVLEGYVTEPPHGHSTYPFSKKELLNSQGQPRAELYGYQRLLDDATVIHAEGVEGIHIWHDKTTIVKTTEVDPDTGTSASWVHVFTRTFNNSDHYQSMESQAHMRFRADSPVAAEIETAIKETARAEKQFAIDLNKAIVRDWLGRFTDHSLYDLDVDGDVTPIIETLNRKDYKTFANLISKIADRDSKLDHKPNVEAVQEHTRKMVDFLNWYQNQFENAGSDPASALNPMNATRAVDVGVAIATGDAWGLKDALDQLYYNSRRAPEDTLALEEKAWTQGLKMPGNMPEPRNPGNRPLPHPESAAALIHTGTRPPEGPGPHCDGLLGTLNP